MPSYAPALFLHFGVDVHHFRHLFLKRFDEIGHLQFSSFQVVLGVFLLSDQLRLGEFEEAGGIFFTDFHGDVFDLGTNALLV